jgi:hypothetical protein
MRAVQAAKKRRNPENNRAGAKAAQKAGGNKYERLILSRGVSTPSKKYLDGSLIVKIGPNKHGSDEKHECDGPKEPKR